MSKSLEFFATAADLAEVLEVCENANALSFIEVGVHSESPFVTFSSYKRISGLGVAVKGDRNHEAAYLVVDSSQQFASREMLSRDGTTKQVVDQLSNPDSVVLRPGGMFQSNCVVAGQVGTCTSEPNSLHLFQLLAKAFRAHFKKVRSYWVGSEALNVMKEGGRLTANFRAPREYDLSAT